MLLPKTTTTEAVKTTTYTTILTQPTSTAATTEMDVTVPLTTVDPPLYIDENSSGFCNPIIEGINTGRLCAVIEVIDMRPCGPGESGKFS